MKLRFWLERSNVTNTPINWINEDLERRFERKLFIQEFCGFPKCTDNGKAADCHVWYDKEVLVSRDRFGCVFFYHFLEKCCRSKRILHQNNQQLLPQTKGRVVILFLLVKKLLIWIFCKHSNSIGKILWALFAWEQRCESVPSREEKREEDTWGYVILPKRTFQNFSEHYFHGYVT